MFKKLISVQPHNTGTEKCYSTLFLVDFTDGTLNLKVNVPKYRLKKDFIQKKENKI